MGVQSMTGSGTAVVDTATVVNSLQLSEEHSNVTIQSTITKVSGTVAGAVKVQGSLDGVSYYDIPAALTDNAVVTFSPANVASQNVCFVIKKSPFLYYQVSYTGAGTMNATISSNILGR